MRFRDQVVIITGGAKGIGAGCARVFASEGGHVAILDADTGETLAAALSTAGPGAAEFFHCDVAEAEPFRDVINTVAMRYGRLDCLINNAGIHPPATSIDETSVEEMERLMRVNYLSTFIGCKFALPHLRRTRGTIVNMSSMTAVLGQHLSTAYCATKAAQVGLTKALAIEAGPYGVRVNAILPSNVDTPLMRDWAATLEDPASALDRVARLQVLGRMATPEEIGRIALFLATEESSFLTGQAIEAEGGASLDY
jgi:L-fucose dehydrogenase